jgi:hypothetical protein
MFIVMRFSVVLLLFFVVVFAGNGVAGEGLITLLAKWFNADPASALSIYTSILTIVYAGARVILKKIPTKMNGSVSFMFWHVMSFLFGDGVKLENHTDNDYVKEQLKKKYPLLNIEIKK